MYVYSYLGKGNGRGISGFVVNRGSVNRGFTVILVPTKIKIAKKHPLRLEWHNYDVIRSPCYCPSSSIVKCGADSWTVYKNNHSSHVFPLWNSLKCVMNRSVTVAPSKSPDNIMILR